MEVVRKCRPYTRRIVTVDDGSTDQTPEYLRHCETDVIGWPQNRGKGAALLEGFRYLLQDPQWTLAVTLDSDGQHAPEDLPHFLLCYQETRADLIVGRRRFEAVKAPIIRRGANTASSALISRITGLGLDDIQCGYRLFSRRAIEQLTPLLSSTSYAIETEMALLARKHGFRIEQVDIQCIYTPEAHQKSSWRPLYDSYNIAKVVLKSLLSS